MVILTFHVVFSFWCRILLQKISGFSSLWLQIEKQSIQPDILQLLLEMVVYMFNVALSAVMLLGDEG